MYVKLMADVRGDCVRGRSRISPRVHRGLCAIAEDPVGAGGGEFGAVISWPEHEPIEMLIPELAFVRMMVRLVERRQPAATPAKIRC